MALNNINNIFASMASAPAYSNTPQKVETLESQQPSELTQRLKVKTGLARSLKEKIIERRLSRGYKSLGLEQLIDLTPLESGEFLIFCRKFSLLEAKISLRRAARSPEEILKAMLAATVKGYCKTCYEVCQSCTCTVQDQIWI